uniref:G_PROTEIN_RECEP_F1_2 domain-containing protein n=1 Tax=Heterorhabditis bacteriophora TaxID=37862 RepID=A0A1I7X8S7_HETBA
MFRLAVVALLAACAFAAPIESYEEIPAEYKVTLSLTNNSPKPPKTTSKPNSPSLPASSPMTRLRLSSRSTLRTSDQSHKIFFNHLINVSLSLKGSKLSDYIMNSTSHCIPEEQLRLSGSHLEFLLYTVFFPPLCIFGFIGNALTITVLVSNDVMSRANVFLACLAVCDMCFLILIIPHSMANFDLFALSYSFRYFYLPSKVHLIAFANWSSAVAIWLVVAVSFERVLGVRSPLHRLAVPSRGKLVYGLLLLLSACALLTFYNHVSHHCVVKAFCNGTQLMAICLDVNTTIWPGNRTNTFPPLLRQYVRWTNAANAAVVVIVPLILLVTLNAMLMYYVKKRLERDNISVTNWMISIKIRIP